MTSYKHTQIGYLILSILCVILALYIFLAITISTQSDDFTPAIIAVMALVLFILASFSTLTVSIDEKYLRVKFGYGIFAKKFPLAEVASYKTVKNHWYYGWGIRLWLWPTMWIYNVSGFDAVELTMKNGRIYRIGTDEPQELATAIAQARGDGEGNK